MTRDSQPLDRAGDVRGDELPADRRDRLEAFAEVARQFPAATLAPWQRAMGWQRLQRSLLAGQAAPEEPVPAWWARLWLRSGPRLAVAFAVTAILIPVAWRLTRTTPPAPLQFSVSGDGDGHADPGATGAEVSSSKGPVTVRFTDGSRVWLRPETRVTVGSLAATGSAVRLLDGFVEVDVRHRPGATWTFAAGPFVVHVKGTSFALGWQAASHRFQLTMHTGEVALVGPGDRAPRMVAAGASVFLDDLGRPLAREVGASAPAEAPAPSPSTRAAFVAAPALRDDKNRRTQSHHVARSLPAHPAWTQLLTHGDFDAIVDQATRRGVDACLGFETEQNLAALADAARYTHRRELARRSLMALRTRFASGERARDAAFFLGRLSETGNGDGREALTWYDRYLREATHGSYAEEALGRQLILLRRDQQLSAARDVAKRYLASYPRGVYVHEATQVLVDHTGP